MKLVSGVWHVTLFLAQEGRVEFFLRMACQSPPTPTISFEKAIACLWNSATVSLRNTDSLENFKSGLQPYLCAITYAT